MFINNTVNPLLPVTMDENRIPYQANASNQLQLFDNLPAGCEAAANHFGNEHLAPMLRANKRGREATEDLGRQQKLQISLNYNIGQDDGERCGSIPKANPVSTGLRLSYDDDELNSSVTSASGSMLPAPPSIISALGINVATELDRQKEEVDQYIKLQGEQLAKGLRDLTQRHIVSFLAAVEKGICKKLREKEVELESTNRRNKELMDRIKHMAMETQNWHYRAKYNESIVHILKTNLQQAISQGADQWKEGFGDSEVDDTASYIDPSSYLNIAAAGISTKPLLQNYHSARDVMACRACRTNEVSVLFMPCRHLCLCKDCDMVITVCPVCQLVKTASFQVYLS